MKRIFALLGGAEKSCRAGVSRLAARPDAAAQRDGQQLRTAGAPPLNRVPVRKQVKI